MVNLKILFVSDVPIRIISEIQSHFMLALPLHWLQIGLPVWLLAPHWLMHRHLCIYWVGETILMVIGDFVCACVCVCVCVCVRACEYVCVVCV